MRKRIALASALLAIIGAAPLAYAERISPPPLSESQMQGLSNPDPVWHPNDQSTVVIDRYGNRVQSSAVLPPHDDIILPDDATNTMTPAEASRITGHVDSAAGPPRTGSDEQAGNMGPNSTKGK